MELKKTTTMDSHKASSFRREAAAIGIDTLTGGQRDNLARLLAHLKEAAAESFEPNEDTSYLYCPQRDPRSRVLLIDGGRGSGKTSLLYTALNLLRSVRKSESWPADAVDLANERQVAREDLAAVVPVQPIDLHVLPTDTRLLMYLASKLHGVTANPDTVGSPARPACEAGATFSPWDLSRPAPSPVASAWDAFVNAAAAGWDSRLVARSGHLDIEAYTRELEIASQKGLEVQTTFSALIDALCKDFLRTSGKTPLFVLSIDDADMSPVRNVELIHLLRLLHHPRLLFLLTGDTELFLAALSIHYQQKQAEAGAKDISPSAQRAVQDLPRQVYDRVVPAGQRLRLPPLSPEDRLSEKHSRLEALFQQIEYTAWGRRRRFSDFFARSEPRMVGGGPAGSAPASAASAALKATSPIPSNPKRGDAKSARPKGAPKPAEPSAKKPSAAATRRASIESAQVHFNAALPDRMRPLVDLETFVEEQVRRIHAHPSAKDEEARSAAAAIVEWLYNRRFGGWGAGAQFEISAKRSRLRITLTKAPVIGWRTAPRTAFSVKEVRGVAWHVLEPGHASFTLGGEPLDEEAVALLGLGLSVATDMEGRIPSVENDQTPQAPETWIPVRVLPSALGGASQLPWPAPSLGIVSLWALLLRFWDQIGLLNEKIAPTPSNLAALYVAVGVGWSGAVEEIAAVAAQGNGVWRALASGTFDAPDTISAWATNTAPSLSAPEYGLTFDSAQSWLGALKDALHPVAWQRATAALWGAYAAGIGEMGLGDLRKDTPDTHPWVADVERPNLRNEKEVSDLLAALAQQGLVLPAPSQNLVSETADRLRAAHPDTLSSMLAVVRRFESTTGASARMVKALWDHVVDRAKLPSAADLQRVFSLEGGHLVLDEGGRLLRSAARPEDLQTWQSAVDGGLRSVAVQTAAPVTLAWKAASEEHDLGPAVTAVFRIAHGLPDTVHRSGSTVGACWSEVAIDVTPQLPAKEKMAPLHWPGRAFRNLDAWDRLREAYNSNLRMLPQDPPPEEAEMDALAHWYLDAAWQDSAPAPLNWSPTADSWRKLGETLFFAADSPSVHESTRDFAFRALAMAAPEGGLSRSAANALLSGAEKAIGNQPNRSSNVPKELVDKLRRAREAHLKTASLSLSAPALRAIVSRIDGMFPDHPWTQRLNASTHANDLLAEIDAPQDPVRGPKE